MPIKHGLALFATDARPRYTNDVLTVLSLPAGAAYQFRYDNKYFPPEISDALDAGKAEGTAAVVCFRGKPTSTFGECVTAIRHVKILRVESVADFRILYFKVDGYADTRFDTSRLDTMVDATTEYLDSLPPKHRDKPVQHGMSNLVVPQPAADRQGWINVATALSKHPTYEQTHFLRVEQITTSEGALVNPDGNGVYEFSDEKLYYLNMHYYAHRFDIADARLVTSADNAIIRMASSSVRELDSRYDSLKSWLHVQPVAGATNTEISVVVSRDGMNAPKTRVTLPVIVRRSTKVLTGQVLLSAVSGILIALPALLGPGVNLTLRILCAVVGAVLLALVTYVIRKAPK